jgi:hypothetical protein
MDPVLIDFFLHWTVLGDCVVPQAARRTHYRGVPNWQSFQVTRPGEPAANQAWPEHAPRHQVWITRGTYTRVILLADSEEAQSVPSQQWA